MRAGLGLVAVLAGWLGWPVEAGAPDLWTGVPLPPGRADAGNPDDSLAPLVPGEDGAPAAVAPGAAAGSGEDEEVIIVISATRTPQKIEVAPSIVSVISREDILTMGYRTLGEVLRNVVGFEVNDNGHWPDTGVRGVNDATSYGDKIRFQVDGHNMAWRQFDRNFHNPTWVDLEDVQRIELIRGPGAAVWGANALAGVVNVVTRDGSNLRGAQATYGLSGAAAGQFASARVGGTLGEVTLFGSFSYYQDDADKVLAPLREFTLLGQNPAPVVGDREEGTTVSLKARYKQLRLWVHQSRYDTSAPLSTFSVLGGDDSRFVTDRQIVRLEFEQMLAVGLELRAEAAFDQYAFDPATAYENDPQDPMIGDPGIDEVGHYLRKMLATDRRYEAKAQLTYLPSLNLQALGGVDFEFLDLVRWYFPEVWAAQALPYPAYSNMHVGAYGHLQYQPVELLELTAGARYDFDQVYGSVLAPRAAAVVRLPFNLFVKGLFGSAYRAPSFHDLYYFRKNAFYGNRSLKPETSLTGELQVGYSRPGLVRLSLTGFLTRISNLIAYTPRAAGTALEFPEIFPTSQVPDALSAYQQKSNTASVTSAGLEAEAWYQPIPALVVQGHATVRRPRDETDARLNYTAQWVVGGAASWKVSRELTATLRFLASGDKPVPARGMTEPGYFPWTAAEDPTRAAPPSLVATAVLRAALNQHLALSLKLDNVTDAWWYDAGRDVLYPQRRFQATGWITGTL